MKFLVHFVEFERTKGFLPEFTKLALSSPAAVSSVEFVAAHDNTLVSEILSFMPFLFCFKIVVTTALFTQLFQYSGFRVVLTIF